MQRAITAWANGRWLLPKVAPRTAVAKGYVRFAVMPKQNLFPQQGMISASGRSQPPRLAPRTAVNRGRVLFVTIQSPKQSLRRGSITWAIGLLLLPQLVRITAFGRDYARSADSMKRTLFSQQGTASERGRLQLLLLAELTAFAKERAATAITAKPM
jgi:hypothetical protein